MPADAVQSVPQPNADIKYMAYEKADHKVACALCKMYFDRSSVTWTTSNHKIITKQRDWNVHLTGRRYQSGSFLYGEAKLCTFCAQFFAETEGDNKVNMIAH
jgi:hypothetical protein